MRIDDLRFRSLELIETDSDLGVQTRRAYARHIDDFCRSMRARGIGLVAGLTTELVDSFLVEAIAVNGFIQEPSENSQRLRRNAYDYLRRQLHVLGSDLPRPSRINRWRIESTIRPLNDEEMQSVVDNTRLRLVTNIDAVYVALARSGATTGEMSRILFSDVDIEARTVQLSNRRGDRENGLDTWSVCELAQYTEASDGAAWQLLLGPDRKQSSIGTQASESIRSSLNAAGLGDDASVKPSSIRYWSALSLHDLGTPIEGVADWLGLASLDTAAQSIGYDWRSRG
jgi:site-specific recombinase XerD